MDVKTGGLSGYLYRMYHIFLSGFHQHSIHIVVAQLMQPKPSACVVRSTTRAHLQADVRSGLSEACGSLRSSWQTTCESACPSEKRLDCEHHLVCSNGLAHNGQPSLAFQAFLVNSVYSAVSHFCCGMNWDLGRATTSPKKRQRQCTRAWRGTVHGL
jgi:hypothetical protein